MFILLSSLLVLAQMQLLLLDYKVFNQFKERQRVFQSLERAAARLTAEMDLPGECVLQKDAANLVVDLLKRKGGCLFIYEKKAYYYLIEDLGLFPCLQVQREQLSYGTHHRRLSLRSRADYPAILQIRYARLAKFVSCTMQRPGQGRLGVLSWRLLRIE